MYSIIGCVVSSSHSCECEGQGHGCGPRDQNSPCFLRGGCCLESCTSGQVEAPGIACPHPSRTCCIPHANLREYFWSW